MYPIRKTRPFWVHTFLKSHVCNELCNAKYEIQDNVFRLTYQTGCLFPEKVEPVCVHISQYKEDVMQLNDIIFDYLPKNITLLIDYPFRTNMIREYTLEDTVNLSVILEKFDEMYKEAYKEELENSTIKEFQIKKSCVECKEEKYVEENIDQFLKPMDSIDIQCNICFEEGEDIVELYLCKHYYHKKCILKWFNTVKITETEEEEKSNSCPSCRQPIIYCENCKSLKYTVENYSGPVIPYPLNEEEDRIETDGPYQIHTLYYEELLFKGILYDKLTNHLKLLPYERLP